MQSLLSLLSEVTLHGFPIGRVIVKFGRVSIEFVARLFVTK